MHPHVNPAQSWPEWIFQAAHKLTGYTLSANRGIETEIVVNTEAGLIEALPTLTPEQLLTGLLLAAVYIRTGGQQAAFSEETAKILPFPHIAISPNDS